MSCRGKGFNCPNCYQKTFCDEYEEPIKLNPIGLEPKEIWLKTRKKDILEAIDRYVEANISVPAQWIKELRELEESGI